MSRAGLPDEPDSATAPRPALAAAGAGIAIGRRAGRAQVTALVLALRRRTEAEAQEQLQRVRSQLEFGLRAQAQAQRQLELAEHGLTALLTRPTPEVTVAQVLANQSARLLQQRQLVQKQQHQLAAQAAQVQTLLQQQGVLHEALRLALARREAAELYEAEERRDQRRIRAQRQRTLEEEARDRFLSAQRQAKSPRR